MELALWWRHLLQSSGDAGRRDEQHEARVQQHHALRDAALREAEQPHERVEQRR